MNIIKRWKHNRELRRIKTQADAEVEEKERELKLLEQQERLRKAAESVNQDMGKLGFVVLDRWACDDDYEDCTTYASHPSGGIYKIKLFIKGGYSITKL